ncbi:MAG: hypothetical protein AAB524_01730 [Patescibacteria group bacterium]
MNQKGFIPIIVIVGIAILVAGVLGYVAVQTFVSSPEPSPAPSPVPTPPPAGGPAPVMPSPTPEPTPAPTPTPTPVPAPVPSPSPLSTEIITETIGEIQGVYLRNYVIQKINPDSVEMLRKASSGSIPYPDDPGGLETFYVGKEFNYYNNSYFTEDNQYHYLTYCAAISIKLTGIDFVGQTVTFTKTVSEAPSQNPCLRAVCLAGNMLIDTPTGLIMAKDLQVDMPVWTVDKVGNRTPGIIIKTSKVPVPATHQMVHLMLEDGRELLVSPGHPTYDGRIVGDLVPDDLYDGARVISANRVTYNEGATYDILPSGDTGFYWANGVRMGSTLFNK